ncbi:glycosyltransferase family 4 protein [Neobacillus pocheonensis]|uniref:Glycosyltransferase family 4 protein n=1 Tax=Neobacillus pocheonensis TaxID=363869 RepID=A0ABT0WJY3_9BACI|nr:glycosyltransferase family 4 protein [Neobacillus pocheonensis]
MKKICLIGQFPPPVHGLSKALDTIIKSEYLTRKYQLVKIDIKNNIKIINHLKQINKSDCDLYYFTISQTKFGNLRDMFILWKLLHKKKKVVIHYHGGYYKELFNNFNSLQKIINKKLISNTDIMIALSDGLKEIFEDVIDIKKIRICENYVEDSSLIDNNEFDIKISEMNQVNQKLEIVYLSNFIKSKGYFDVLKAAKKLKGQNVLFHFAGDFFSKQEEKEFNDYVQINNLKQSVIYHGVVKGQKKKDLLFKGDIFTLPTYYPKEGQPISIIEAMGNGLTIITTNHAGIPDIVNLENGYLIKPKSPNEIVEVITDLLKNRNKLVDFAKKNRNYTLMKFKEIDYIKRLENIFDEVFENGN